jgi:nucleotide-binding universal stress UspA family protein
MVPTTIMVATDASENAQKAETFAAELADAMRDVTLLAVTVVPPRELPPIMPSDLEEMETPRYSTETGGERKKGEELLEEAARRMSRVLKSDAVKVETRVIENKSAAKAIVEEALVTGECRMIVVGSRGHGGLPGLLMGSVSSQVLHGAHCPVLVVKS